MKRKNLRLIIGASLLVFGTSLACLLAIFEKPGSIYWSHGMQYRSEKDYFSQSYQEDLPEISEVETLTIISENASVTVIEGDKFDVRASNIASENDVEIAYSKGNLTIDVSNGKNYVTFNLGLIIEINNQELTIEIPKKHQLSQIKAENKNGGFEFTKLTNLNKIEATTPNGYIDFKSTSAQEITAKTINGSIDLVNGTFKVANLSTKNGDVTVENATFDNFFAQSNNGEIELTKSKIKTDGEIKGKNGDIDLTDCQIPNFFAKSRIGDSEIIQAYQAKKTRKELAKLIITSNLGDVTLK
ncbi:hypothetical protein Hs30E_17700 [Lactococcus hodotermopsidis]|uniref:DUF4097 domain-containing protein n=1 Tax=Pseudolactococcus hodotermopsidis TaxID=2709157 RepID=A0A6A0BCR8_9LACT|nr:DUF4097 family beta strand repeat-containing protein [Lactococcus hodotermopsidis]GFH43219.1 hypothetical protein Hs30E_17700 [Lactococcus hodotermopsidis]